MNRAGTWLAGLALLFGPGSPFALSGQDLKAGDKPNIIIIIVDDMGYSDLGCYGGEIHTPNIDKLASNGLRFTNFYNTGRCWPTRSSLLSGYYATAIGMDPIRPQKPCPSWVKTMPQYLGEAGYKTYHSGKYHFFNKPLPVKDGGFDRSYWTEGDCFNAIQHLDDQPLEKHTSKDGKILTAAIADHAIAFLQDYQENESGKPFFLYLAYHAPHFPLMALEEDVAKYRDRYRRGWDALKKERWQRMKKEGLVKHDPPPAEEGINQTYAHLMPDGILLDSLGSGEVLFPVPWESLNAEQKEFQAMKMAIHAAMVDRVDQETGRVLEQVASMGALENTVIFFLSDNGASAEMMIRGNGHDPAKRPGADSTYLCLGPGWANASNTPFRRYKSWTHEGGTATPLIVHWPKVIRDKGALRDDPGHVVDFLPTLLELAGLEQAESWQGSRVPELHGKSLVPAFVANGSVNRDYLYFHHYGLFEADAHNRALRMGNWKIVSSGTDDDRWELYNLQVDRGEQNNLALEKPFLLDVMIRKWEKANSECNQLSSQMPIPDTQSDQLLSDENILQAMEEARMNAPEDPFRPGYHLVPPAGFMGDPNGGIWHHGWYHIFYLHNPFSGEPGPWYWAHARSRDLVHWEHLKPGVKPPYEMNVGSVISGSTIISREGEPVALYSASDGESIKFWRATGSSDLLEWTNKGQVSGISLDHKGLPAFDRSWRDPFVFEAEGRTFMLLCADLFDEPYVPLPIFEASNNDLISWVYKGILFKYPKYKLRNLEVPELRPLGDKWLLTASCDAPVDMTRYFVGDLDLEHFTFTPSSEGPLDYSGHYYAQESIQDSLGNLCMMAWMSGWDRDWMPNFREEDRKNTDDWWNGCFAIPRQLSLDSSGNLIQQPAESMQKLRFNHVRLGPAPLVVKNVIAAYKVLEEVRGNQLEVDLELELGTASFCGMNLLCDNTGHGGLSIMWSGDVINVDEISIPLAEWKPGVPLQLHVFVDRQYVELFINGGRYCVTRKVKKNNILGDYVSLAWLGGHAALNHLDAWQLKDTIK